MQIQPIHTEREYKAALKAVSPMFDNEPEPGTPQGDFFDVMVTLIEVYEARHFPLDLPDPIAAIRFRMEQSGLSAADLVPAIGRQNRVYEVLNGTRALTLPMIWRLHEMFGIPAESLIKPARSSASG